MCLNKLLISLLLVTNAMAGITSCLTKGSSQFGVSGGSSVDNLSLITPLETVGTLIRLT